MRLGEEAADGFARGAHDVVEGYRAVVHGDVRIGAGAVDAETRRRAEAFDAHLPGLVVEMHGRLAARPTSELYQGEREVTEDERAVRLAHERGDVGPVDEDVEELARRAAASPRDDA